MTLYWLRNLGIDWITQYKHRKGRKMGMELQTGGHRLNHGLNDSQEKERQYSEWIEGLERGQDNSKDRKNNIEPRWEQGFVIDSGK